MLTKAEIQEFYIERSKTQSKVLRRRFSRQVAREVKEKKILKEKN